MGVNHSGTNVFVTEEFLHGANIISRFEEVGGKRMAEGVTGDAFGEAQKLDGFSNDLLDGSLTEMMSPHQPGVGVGRASRGRKDILPAPFSTGIRVFLGQGMGQVNTAIPGLEVFLVEQFDPLQMGLQGSSDLLREYGAPVFVPFALVDDELILGKINIFDPQAEGFHKPEAAAIQ